MDYMEVLPDPALRPWIRCYWFLRGAPPAGQAEAEPALPDGSPELILNLAAPFEAMRGGRAVSQPAAMLVGQITRPIVVRPTGEIDLVAVRFEPFGASFVHGDMAALTDTWVDLDDGAPEIAALGAVLRPLSREARVARLDAMLVPWLAARTGPDPRVVRAVGMIVARHGAVSLHEIARDLGVTARTLQRLFAAQVGLSPKLLARIRRFHGVFAAWRRDPGALARVAAECGYFDQSHLVRDFRDFAGVPPAAFLASMPAFTALFTASPPSAGKGRLHR